jgi:hypothetical protein
MDMFLYWYQLDYNVYLNGKHVGNYWQYSDRQGSMGYVDVASVTYTVKITSKGRLHKGGDWHKQKNNDSFSFTIDDYETFSNVW